MRPERKSRLVKAVERYVVNPPVRAAAAMGIAGPVCLLETKGRRTGKVHRVPIMNGRVGDDFWIVAEHGHRAGYVKNLKADPAVRIKIGRRWFEGKARVVDENAFDRVSWIAKNTGRSPKMEVLVNRLLSAEPVTVKVDMATGSG